MKTTGGTSTRAEGVGRSDDDLLAATRAGDREAFGDLFDRHEPAVRRFARSLVPHDDVDDVVAETFTKVLGAIESGRGPIAEPVRYLMVTTRTTAYSLHRRAARAADKAHRAGHDVELVLAGPDVPDEQLLDAFRSLPKRWREVIWWSEVEGLGPVDIGERLGIAPPAAASLAYRARRALRAAYCR